MNFFHEIGEKLRLKVNCVIEEVLMRSAGFFSRVEIFGTKSCTKLNERKSKFKIRVQVENT